MIHLHGTNDNDVPRWLPVVTIEFWTAFNNTDNVAREAVENGNQSIEHVSHTGRKRVLPLNFVKLVEVRTPLLTILISMARTLAT